VRNKPLARRRENSGSVADEERKDSPERLGAQELRRYQLYLLREKKLAQGTVENCIWALRFLYNEER
jgi:hypothetical protein